MTVRADIPAADARAAVLVTATALSATFRSGRPVTVLAVRSDDSVAPRPHAGMPRIAGALETSLATDFAAPSDPVAGTRPLPSPDALQAAVARWGITPETLVVVYDHDGGLIAARAWWVLRWAGLDVRILDGGFQAWVAAGLPTDRSPPPPPPPPPGTAIVRAGHLPTFDADGAIALGRHGVLVDSRVAENYAGAAVPPGAPRRGHVPGAISVPAPANLDAEGRFLDERGLRDLYAASGALTAARVGVYCGAGVSAAHDIAALATLGVEAALYPGSWSAWISDPDRPAVIGTDLV